MQQEVHKENVANLQLARKLMQEEHDQKMLHENNEEIRRVERHNMQVNILLNIMKTIKVDRIFDPILIISVIEKIFFVYSNN